METLELILGDCADKLKDLPSSSIDLVVTSPPYDDLREYKGYSFNFENIANELYRVLKLGGVIVWIVNDATVNGDKTGTSFRQVLYFKEIGLRLHDTMIWNKGCFTAVGSLTIRYAPVFEFMFILSKQQPKTFNPLKDRPNKCIGDKYHGHVTQADGTFKPMSNQGRLISDFGQRFNVWEIPPAVSLKDRCCHPAPFPRQLAKDHILSWSNEGDTILDPFLGSGTTGVAAVDLNRKFIGIEIAPEYFEIAKRRITDTDFHAIPDQLPDMSIYEEVEW